MKISGCPIGAQLAGLAKRSDSSLIADAADRHWLSIHHSLSVIIGVNGVAALYRRSVYLARGRHAWLIEPAPSELPSAPLVSLRRALSAQSGAEAAAAQLTLLQTFNDLLEHLIGSSLTDRLLGPVWQQPAATPEPEDHAS